MRSKCVKLTIRDKIPVDKVSLPMNGNKDAIRVLVADVNPTNGIEVGHLSGALFLC